MGWPRAPPSAGCGCMISLSLLGCIDNPSHVTQIPPPAIWPSRGSAMRCALVAVALVALATPALSLDVPPALTTPSVAQPSQEQEGRPSLLRRVSAPLATPVRMFREAPPITRSWVSASVVMAMLSQARVIDLRNVCFDERAVWYKGEWWRLLTNFFFMGDSVLSVFFWMQIYHFWECLKARRRSSSRRRRRVHTAPTRCVHRAPRPCRRAWWPAAERHTGRCSLDRPPMPGRCSSWASTGTSLRTSSR